MQPNYPRIASLDLLKGLVIVIMALDHTRDYFHADSFLFDPTDPFKTNPYIFFTRWITHYCAPVFSILAGTSAYLVGRRKSKNELATFLLKRGLWLILIEFTLVEFGWMFSFQFQEIHLGVIWSLGISMVLLAGLIYLPMRWILSFSLLLIFGHNLLDTSEIASPIMALLHQRGVFNLVGIDVVVIYPIIPWVGVMAFGFILGQWYNPDVSAETRKRLLKQIGWGAIALFFVVRGINGYGNPWYWETFDSFWSTLFTFLNPLKYPPSLSYLLMTLGPAMLLLAYTENFRGQVAKFFTVFGKVPFFFYILHIYLIHLFALVWAGITGFGWKTMILNQWVIDVPELQGYGLSLVGTYLIWVLVILTLYPLCAWFGKYKSNHKEKKWLSYL